MRPGSPWLAELEHQRLQEQTLWVNCYSELNVFVTSPSARIASDRALNVVVPRRGHQGIASSPFLVDHLVGQVVAAERRARPVAA
jgi:hypothetical protein